MKTRFYVAVGARGAARLTKGKPRMRAGEVAVAINLEIPDSAFRSPFVEANIEVPEGFIIKPELEAWLEPIEDEEGE